MGIGREDISGRLALANGKTKHLHLAVKARHTADPAESKTLTEREKKGRNNITDSVTNDCNFLKP